MVSEYGPGIDAEKSFKQEFEQEGRQQMLDTLRSPLANPDFAPFLQRAADLKPDALFLFVPSGQGATLMKQFVERGLDKAGIKIIGPGDVTDDDLFNGMGDDVIGMVTSHNYSADARFAGKQGVCRRFREGQQQHAAELHGGRRL